MIFSRKPQEKNINIGGGEEARSRKKQIEKM